MDIKIYENDKLINRIVADEDFVADYCARNGYTYEVEPEPEAPAPPRAYTSDEILSVLLGFKKETEIEKEVNESEGYDSGRNRE